jgi:hypothetical protein
MFHALLILPMPSICPVYLILILFHFPNNNRSVYRVLVGKPEGKRPLGRPRRRWEDNIKLDFREIGIDGVNWIQLAQDRVMWQSFLITVINLRVP